MARHSLAILLCVNRDSDPSGSEYLGPIEPEVNIQDLRAPSLALGQRALSGRCCSCYAGKLSGMV